MGQRIDPIPFHGEEKFLPKVTEDELRGFMDIGMATAIVEGSYALWQNDRVQMMPWMVHQSYPAEKKGKC
jgi:hypothetical protein